MLRLLTEEEFCTIEKQARFLAEFGSRRFHKNELKRFELQCNHLKSYLFDHVSYMLSELCSEVKSAFGNVKDKQHWFMVVNQTLGKIKSCGVERNRN